MTSTQVKVNRALSVPAVSFDLPLAADHRSFVTIAPPSAHIGAAPVLMRLISYDLREGQVLDSVIVKNVMEKKSFIISKCYAKLMYLLLTCLALLPCSQC